jgi:c-di-GMP-binding flagellar brake protein YcgR
MEDIEETFVQRRDWPRLAIDKLVEEALVLPSAQTAQKAPRAEIVNLSQAGAGVLTQTKLAKGTHVNLEIRGREIPRLTFQAEVRWTAASPVSTGLYPAGLKFMNLDEPSRTRLRHFIDLMRKHRPPQSEPGADPPFEPSHRQRE